MEGRAQNLTGDLSALVHLVTKEKLVIVRILFQLWLTDKTDLHSHWPRDISYPITLLDPIVTITKFHLVISMLDQLERS